MLLQNLFIRLKVFCIPPNVGGSERTGYDVWQLKCQASNVTASVQTDHLLHGHTLPVFLAINQSHRPPRSAEIQPVSTSRFRNSSVSRIGTRYTRSCIMPQMR